MSDLTPRTKHGRYVLTTSRLHTWPAFDANDIIQIEEEAARMDAPIDTPTGRWWRATYGSRAARQDAPVGPGLREAVDEVRRLNERWNGRSQPPTDEGLREALDTLRRNERTTPDSEFWEGWDAALAAVEVALSIG